MTIDVKKLGQKRPQIIIPLDLIKLDNQNPRIDEEGIKKNGELSLTKYFYVEYDLEGLAYSLAENGYFEAEPIVVVPNNLPKKFKWDKDVDKIEEEIKKLVALKSVNFTVIEGNRRIAAAKLLIDMELRKKLNIDRLFPKISNFLIEKDLKTIPSIVYKKREEVFSYLGIKHIEGPLKWGAYSKAKYIAKMIDIEKESNKDINKCIKIVQDKIADRSDIIKKQYMSYKLFEQARRESLDVDFKNIINRFSLIGELLSKPSIRDFIGVLPYTEIDFTKNLVPKGSLDNVERLLTWVFGSDDKQPIITDSRKIKFLSPVLANKESLDHFIRYEILEDAYELSGGERAFLVRKLAGVKKSISTILGLIYKFKKDKEIGQLIKEIKEAVNALVKSKND